MNSALNHKACKAVLACFLSLRPLYHLVVVGESNEEDGRNGLYSFELLGAIAGCQPNQPSFISLQTKQFCLLRFHFTTTTEQAKHHSGTKRDCDAHSCKHQVSIALNRASGGLAMLQLEQGLLPRAAFAVGFGFHKHLVVQHFCQ